MTDYDTDRRGLQISSHMNLHELRDRMGANGESDAMELAAHMRDILVEEYDGEYVEDLSADDFSAAIDEACTRQEAEA